LLEYILNSYDEKTQGTQTAKQLRLHDDSLFATSVPLSDNTACAAFTSTPERAHQKPNITVADVSEISASAQIDNSLGILQNCKMTKVMKICDRYIV
jgi:hypothetical protein